jgi:hypothetical protein
VKKFSSLVESIVLYSTQFWAIANIHRLVRQVQTCYDALKNTRTCLKRKFENLLDQYNLGEILSECTVDNVQGEEELIEDEISLIHDDLVRNNYPSSLSKKRVTHMKNRINTDKLEDQIDYWSSVSGRLLSPLLKPSIFSSLLKRKGLFFGRPLSN